MSSSTPRPAPRHIWTGATLNLRAPKTDDKEPPQVATVKAGSEMVVVAALKEGLLVAFPPVPFLWTLPHNLSKFVQPAKETAATADGDLTPESLLTILQHPQIIEHIQALVAQQPEAAKAAAMPLVSPLVAAFVPPAQMGFVTSALASFGIK